MTICISGSGFEKEGLCMAMVGRVYIEKDYELPYGNYYQPATFEGEIETKGAYKRTVFFRYYTVHSDFFAVLLHDLYG